MSLKCIYASSLGLPIGIDAVGMRTRKGSVRGRPHSGAVGRDEHWDRPYVQGTGQPRAVSESSESMAQAALQGLTCEKKTKSILVKAADLYSK